jgi:hypothetical protein
MEHVYGIEENIRKMIMCCPPFHLGIVARKNT